MLKITQKDIGTLASALDPRSDFRDESVVDLSNCSVGVAGCGSGGSLAALALASCGIGRLDLSIRDSD